MQDCRDVEHIRGVRALSLDYAGKYHHLVQGHARSVHLFLKPAGELIVEVPEEFAYHILQVLPLIEVIGVGEKIALKLIVPAPGVRTQGRYLIIP